MVKRNRGICLFVALSALTISSRAPAQLSRSAGIPFAYSSSYRKGYTPLGSDSVLTKIGQWGWGPCDAVAVKGNYAFIGNGRSFQVLDVSNPAKPVLVAQLLTKYTIFKVVVSGNFAYLLPFGIIDISDPQNPVLVNTAQVPGILGPTTITVSGNYVYIGNFPGTIYTIDVTDPYNAVMLNSVMYTSGEMVESIVVKDTVLYAITYDGRMIDGFSISNPESPVRITQTPSGGFGSAMAVKGNYLYIVDLTPFCRQGEKPVIS